MGIAETIGDSTASWSYNYDGLDRLTVAERCIGSGATTTTYAYDEVGNRLAMTRTGCPQTATCQYNALDQLIQESDLYGTETDYLYDGNGNLTGKHWNTGQVNYAYDMRNRLSKAYNGAALPENLSAEYTYDYSGARIEKTEFGLPGAAKQTSFLIDDNNLTGYAQTFSESDSQTGEIETLYVYGDDLYCQVSTNATPLDTPEYFLYDGLGSTRSLTDHNGDILQSYNYRPFGEGIDLPSSLSTNHLFTGEYLDSALDYYYLRARYYSPSMGRFTGYDPVEDAANRTHRYLYVAANPIILNDSSGMAIDWKDGWNGTQAHLLFFAFIQFHFPERYKTNKRIARGAQPDVYEEDDRRIWELKPISHSKDRYWGLRDEAQMNRYLARIPGSRRGDAWALVGINTQYIGYFLGLDRLIYDVYVYPHKHIPKETPNRKGMLYYTLEARFDPQPHLYPVPRRVVNEDKSWKNYRFMWPQLEPQPVVQDYIRYWSDLTISGRYSRGYAMHGNQVSLNCLCAEIMAAILMMSYTMRYGVVAG